MDVIASQLLIDGLKTEFADTYKVARKRQSDGRLSMIMDLDVGATNRQHLFGLIESGPHAELWKRGESIPTDGMGSLRFLATVHNYGRRVKWHQDDRADEQTGTLVDMARMAGESFGLLQERMAFAILTGTAGSDLPAIPNAADGAAMFATTANGAARFGATNGNLLSGTGVATLSAIQTDYYSAAIQFGLFQDGKGQPLWSPETIGAGFLIIHSLADTRVFEEAFLQVRQGRVMGTDAGVTPTNIIQDASRKVELWGSPRLPTGDWFVFMKACPKKPLFHLKRKALTELTSFQGDNNSDLTRTTGEEYIQWDSREGAAIALPYGAIKINN